MKRVIVTVCALTGIGVSAPLYADHGHRGEETQVMQDLVVVSRGHDSERLTEQGGFQRQLDRRQTRQHERIRRGWRHGELTGKEFKRLKREQRRIARLVRRFNENGYYSRKERRILREELDRASDHIYRKKHNGSNRYVAGRGDGGRRVGRRDPDEVITLIDSPLWYDNGEGPACADPRYR